jgi:hypothetical protein
MSPGAVLSVIGMSPGEATLPLGISPGAGDGLTPGISPAKAVPKRTHIKVSVIRNRFIVVLLF